MENNMGGIKMKKHLLSEMVTVMAAAVMLAGCGNTAAGTAQSQAAASTVSQAASTAAVSTAASSSSAAGNGSASGKTYKVGIVQYVDDASLNQITENIQKELDAKGKELGCTFDYKDYTMNGQADSTVLGQMATELVNDKVDAIVPIATPTAVIMQSATEDNRIPVVFAAVSDPVGAKLVNSMDAPGANITGVSDQFNTEDVMKLILAAKPDAKKIGLLYDKSQDSSTSSIAAAKDFCKKNGLEVDEKTGTTNDEISLAADSLISDKVDAVFTPSDNTVMTAELSIYEKFADAKIPHFGGADSFALNGAFCGYGVNYADLGKETADMVVDIIANGADPASTPVKTMENGIATVNTDIAGQIGLDYSMFKGMCSQVVETKTAESFGK
jgi:putative ABC transport system substrate-binding protein